MACQPFGGPEFASALRTRARLGDQRTGGKILNLAVVQSAASCRYCSPTWNPPRGDDFDIGLQPIEREFESNLIVSFAGATMGHKTEGRG